MAWSSCCNLSPHAIHGYRPNSAERLAKAYGTRIFAVLEDAKSPGDLGRHFGAGLYEAEIQYLQDKEFARTAEDILWRRSKLGLVMTEQERRAVKNYLAAG